MPPDLLFAFYDLFLFFFFYWFRISPRMHPAARHLSCSVNLNSNCVIDSEVGAKRQGNQRPGRHPPVATEGSQRLLPPSVGHET